MSNILSFSEEFLCDEVRDGFFVSETMKRYWAAQLVVLAEIDKICRKHNINWYADSGTLIGVIRHKGYIPWDDDIDISMLRDDYEKFFGCACKELPEGYCVLKGGEEYDMPFGRITNGRAIDKSSDYIEKFYGCPFVAGVDIFPLDNVYDDSKLEEDRRRRGELVISTLKGIWGKKLSDQEITECVRKIENENNVVIGKDDTYTKLLMLFEKIAKECTDGKSKKIALMYVWVAENKSCYPRACYAEWSSMSFEDIHMRVPEGYHEILSAYYGDYMKIDKGTAIHVYPVYRKQERIFREKFGKNPCRYYFDNNQFAPREGERTLKSQQLEMLKLLHSLHKKISLIVSSNNVDITIPFLQTCQNTANYIKAVLDGKFGEGTKAAMLLNEYCEKVYEVSNEWSDGSLEMLDSSLDRVRDALDELFDNRNRDILFLLCRASWWDSVKDIYGSLISDVKNSVNVIPEPFFKLHNLKLEGDAVTDKAIFEKISDLNGKITDFEEYNLEKRHPDVIIVQFPYDGYSGTIAISSQLHSENLTKYTDELVYVPFLSPDAPLSMDDVAYKAMRELIEQPAIFNADRVVVKSQELRKYYIEMLVHMTDENMRDYWNKRICVNYDWLL